MTGILKLFPIRQVLQQLQIEGHKELVGRHIGAPLARIAKMSGCGSSDVPAEGQGGSGPGGSSGSRNVQGVPPRIVWP